MQATRVHSSQARGPARLSSHSLLALQAALPALYASTETGDLAGTFLSVVSDLIPGESHGVVVREQGQERRQVALRPASVDHERLLPAFFAHFSEFAPSDYRKLTGSGEALALSDFIATPSLHRLGIYGEYYRPIGIADDLSVNLRRGDDVICVAVLRRARGFRRDERDLFNALCPHFRQAWSLSRMIRDLRRKAEAAPIPVREWVPDPLEQGLGLTAREAEVLMWVAQGKTNPEVGEVLGIRPYTVRTHLERIFAKLGVETRHAAGLKAIQVLGLP
ncbi:MAG: LuxR C-terminal-related transcriptional regulator [Opitutaceae bacterium]